MAAGEIGDGRDPDKVLKVTGQPNESSQLLFLFFVSFSISFRMVPISSFGLSGVFK